MRCTGIAAMVFFAACSSPSGLGQPLELDLTSAAEWADLGQECTLEAPAENAPVIVPPSNPLDANARWADIARRAPGGWGGYFVSGGEDTMYLVDPSQADTAAAFLRSEGIPIGSSPVVLEGRWDFAQMYDWYQYLRGHLIEGVTLSDIQEARNRIEYGVMDEEARSGLEGVLADLAVPCFLVAIEIREPAVLLASDR